MVEIRKLKTIDEIVEFTNVFNKSIGYSNVPWQYHASGKCYAMINKGKMEAGFCLIPGYFNLRAILQIPPDIQQRFYEETPKIAKNMCDLTAYFILNPNFRNTILFTIYLVLICLFYSRKYFAYTYPIHDLALEKYYGKGNPLRIHTGVPEHLPGHAKEMDQENVELLTTFGVIKIFFYRTKRMIKARKLRKRK